MPKEPKLVYSRRLPHIQSAYSPLFITWRLKFTLPKSIKHELIKLKQESDANLAHLSQEYKLLQTYSNEKHRFEWYDVRLNYIEGLCITLTNFEIAQIIKDVLFFHHGTRYHLYAFCVMPNHVHVIIQQLKIEDDNPFPLPKITQSWKRHSSMQIKKLLDISDSVWQTESYDHVIRNEIELSYYLEYTLQNPVNAGLVDNWQAWNYSWINPKFV
jgi:putative transposase